MNNPESIFDNPMFKEDDYNLVNAFTGNDMTIDTFFFNPSQKTDYSNSDTGDLCLLFLDGQGKCYLNNSSESSINVTRGSIVYIPKGVHYKIENGNGHMVAVKSASAKHN